METPQTTTALRQYPDFTEEQMAILQQIASNPDYQTKVGYSWSLAFKEHPEWDAALLGDGRPISHLWHASKALRKGKVPVRPFYQNKNVGKRRKKRAVEVVVIGRGKYKRKPWWEKQGLPHPASREARRLREGRARTPAYPRANAVVGEVVRHADDAVTFCPQCGAHKSHFGNRA